MAEVEGSDAGLSGSVGGMEGAPAAGVSDGTAKAETVESEQEDEDDVFEVESILDSKIEGGEVLYRVRWKGYDSEGDTWEPEAHLDDCKEVLLEFRRKQAENKPKPVKKEMPQQKLSPSDLFEADSESEQSDQKVDSPPKKKKKSKEEDEELANEEMKKKKSKSGKSKEKSKAEAELSDSSSPDLKPKKRLSESKEDLSNKKQKKDDLKELKKAKKEDVKDLKVKGKDELKDKKQKKDKVKDCDHPGYARQVSEELSDSISVSSAILTEEKKQTIEEQEEKEQEPVQDLPEEKPSELPGMEEEEDDDEEEIKVKKKKKKHKKIKTERGEETKALCEELHIEKKSSQKKQKSFEKVKELSILERLAPLPAPVQKGSRASTEDKGRKSVDSVSEEKEGRKTDTGKEKTRKKHESEKEGKKEQKVVKTVKESKNIFDAFTVTPEDRNECTESSRIKEEVSLDYRPVEECKTKELKQVFRERQNTRDESEPWAFAASEGDQEVADPLCQMHDNTAPLMSKVQVGLAMDLQLEWMTLEDFQKHLDGTDEILPSETISSSALKDAVKNGDYVTVKYALNSKEEYNLEQEDSSGMTLVMLAAAAGQDDVLRLLIKKGAKINARQKNGTTALIHAAEKNYLTTVALLLEAGAYVNVQQASGETALMKACKRGNSDIVRLLLEYGVDCNVLSKHQGNALQFAMQSNNVHLYEMIKSHLETLSRVVEDAIKDYFDTRLSLLEPVFPLACHRLCEGPDFSLDFSYKAPFTTPEGSGILLFVFHANYFGKEVVVRLCGPCSVQAVVLNDKFQLPVFLVKLLICAYRVQLPYV
uniref:M-phase phosphoprotein 8 n=1 Tax=Xenopus tropicalis TaxID=8364 RepID=A0A6I8PVS1_XENTR|eukprot:XP_017947227.1 PREDICTED: M-phase phosphoprotein 8 isoform X3 [Xenopus tropicalis]